MPEKVGNHRQREGGLDLRCVWRFGRVRIRRYLRHGVSISPTQRRYQHAVLRDDVAQSVPDGATQLPAEVSDGDVPALPDIEANEEIAYSRKSALTSTAYE